jgi:uncharacterized Fe-S cluster-containing radical SAM superfamily protein
MATHINTEAWSARFRELSVDLNSKRLLITNFHDTEQEEDLTEPPNCDGFGRIRHFKRETSPGWLSNPLPLDPACKALDLPYTDILRAQVFQNAVCNWRCWYCFVPFNMLSANRKYSDWLSPTRLINLYLQQANAPVVIDLTGGQPDLIPEWVPWMMAELRTRGMEQKVYLWSDDNLSNDYFWQFLSDADRELMCSYANYGRVCCFKGFNTESFAFNTKAEASLFNRQFDLMGRLLTVGIDLYAYVTFTIPSPKGIAEDIRRFVDRLQTLDENLPLRTVPLEIQVFTPVKRRLDDTMKEALKNQHIAMDAWQNELESRYAGEQRTQCIADVPLCRYGGQR